MDEEKEITPEKTASELVVEIHQNQDRILKHLQNLDFNYKLIINRLDNLTKEIKNKPINQPTIHQNPPKVEAVELPLKDSDNRSNLRKQLEEQQDLEDFEELTVENSHDAIRRTGRNVEPPVKKIPVQQRLLYKDTNKKVFMANVQIFDKNSNIAKSCTTNQMGKFMCALTPGTYLIKVNKSANGDKAAIDLSYNITIPDGEILVNLEDKII